MSSSPFINRLLLILLTPVRGMKAFISGCCCFNSVDNLSTAEETNEEINPADFSDQWKQLWHCAGNSLLPQKKAQRFISHTQINVISVAVRLVAQLRHVLTFTHLSNLVSQLRCCHRLSGAPANDAAVISFPSPSGTTRAFAVVLFLCLKSGQI